MFHERMDEHLKMKIIISGTKQWYDLILDLLSFSFIVFLISFTIIFKDNFSAQTIGILFRFRYFTKIFGNCDGHLQLASFIQM